MLLPENSKKFEFSGRKLSFLKRADFVRCPPGPSAPELPRSIIAPV